jgi:hypothetical protein
MVTKQYYRANLSLWCQPKTNVEFIKCSTQFRYVSALFSVKGGGLNSSVIMEMIEILFPSIFASVWKLTWTKNEYRTIST